MPYVYELTPTDYFAGFQTPEEFIRRSALENGPLGLEKAEQKAMSWLESCRQLARDNGWEGDIQDNDGVRSEGVGAILTSINPDPYLIYIVKQSNNGATFVVSDVPLPDAHDYLKQEV